MIYPQRNTIDTRSTLTYTHTHAHTRTHTNTRTHTFTHAGGHAQAYANLQCGQMLQQLVPAAGKPGLRGLD